MSAVRRAVRSVGRFVRKHWRRIATAAAVVFTAGAAAGGLGAVKGSFAQRGILGGIGSTLRAGASAIGRVVTGQGLTAARTAAQTALGVAPGATTAFGTAAQVAARVPAGTLPTTATTATSTTPRLLARPTTTAPVTPPAGGPGWTLPTVTPPVGAQAPVGPVGPVTPRPPGGFWNSLGGAALIQGGIGAASAALASRQGEESEPLAYWGRDARDGTGGVSPGQLAFAPAGVYGSDASWQPPRNAAARRLLMDPNDRGGG